MNTTGLESVVGCVEEVIASGALLGAQVYASVHGEPVLDVTLGRATPDRDLGPDDPVPWICASKLIATVLTGQLLAAGELDPADRIAGIVPEYGQGGKDEITLEHLMSYTVPYAPYDGPPLSAMSDAGALAAICAIPIEDKPGLRAQYNAVESWQVLAEVLRRRTGVRYADLAAERVLEPLGMDRTLYGRRCQCGTRGSAELRHGELFEPARGEDGQTLQCGVFVPSINIPPPGLSEHLAGTGAHGPARDLARLAECFTLGPDGQPPHPEVLSKPAGELLLRVVRHGLPDDTFGGFDLEWGLGPCVDPLWFSAPRTAVVAGMTGYGCSLVLADRHRGLVVSYLASSVLMGFKGTIRPHKQVVRDLYRRIG